MNLVENPYVFANQTDALTVANEYCTSLNSNPVSQGTNITSLISALAPTYNEINDGNSRISVTSSDISNNCMSYDNVVFVPAISNDDNQRNQIADTIELANRETISPKIESNVNASTFKCVLSSDQPFLNTFIQTPNIDQQSTQTFNGTQKSHTFANNANRISERASSNQVDQQQMYHIVDPNNVNIGMPPGGGEHEVFFVQDENGQLYRPLQNIYVDSSSMCSNELLPIISTPIDIETNATYNGDRVHLQAIQNSYQQNNETTPYEIPVNFITASNSNQQRQSDTINSSTELQEVQFIFDSYGNGSAINDIHRSNTVDPNHFQNEQNAEETNYQTQFEIQSNKEQQNLLESTMSTLRK